jgi:Transcription factor homologous to NACalpha-BTF3
LDIELERIDIVRERTKASYAEAKDALEKNNGNVVDAIIYIEKNQKNVFDNISGAGNEFVEKIKGIVKKGNVNRIRIKKDGKVLLDIPVNAGVVGGAIGIYTLPALVAIGAVAAVVSKVQVEVTRPTGEVEIVEDIAKETTGDVGGVNDSGCCCHKDTTD